MSSLEGLASAEKRKAQNRAAQRKFRNKKKAQEVKMMREKNLMAENEEKLLSEIASLRARLGHDAVKQGQNEGIRAVKADNPPPELVLGEYNINKDVRAFESLTSVESIELPDTTVYNQTISTSPPDFSLVDFEKNGSVPYDEGREHDFPSPVSHDFTFQLQTDDVVNDAQPSYTQRSPTHPLPAVTASNVDLNNQTSLVRMKDDPSENDGFVNNFMEQQNGVFSSLGSDDLFSNTSIPPDAYATNFQVTQLLEAAKHKEHAARLLQEAAYCREYTVRSLLATRGAWALSKSEYPLDTFSTPDQYAYSSELDGWNWNQTLCDGSTIDLPPAITAM